MAFLDESFQVQSRALFFSPNGKMLKQAVYYAGLERILVLVTPFDLSEGNEHAGQLYLVGASDVSRVYQLKGETRVLGFSQAPDGTVYYHALVEEPAEEVPENHAGDSLVRHHPVASARIVIHRLTPDGTDTSLELENALVEDVLPDGKLLLAQVSGFTPFGGSYVRGITARWSLYDPETAQDICKFDYAPLLAPDLSTALEVVRSYDSSDYGSSFFALYEGDIEDASADFRLIYSCPYYVTLGEERWWPVAEFLDEDTVLVSRFVSLEVPEDEAPSVPNTRGRLSLARLDLVSLQFRILLQDAPSSLEAVCEIGAPVFFYTSSERQDADISYRAWAMATDGSKARMLTESKLACRLEIADVDLTRARLLVLEHYETANGKYSVLKELWLSEEPPLQTDSEQGDGGSASARQEVPEAANDGSGPPSISLPGGTA